MLKNEESFKDKCDRSYQICLKELKSPSKNWETDIHNSQFTIDPQTMQPKTFHEFILNSPDNITIDGPQKHTYIFKRSVFYKKFRVTQSRIYKDLTKYYKDFNLFVDLYEKEPKMWVLKLSWNNTRLKSPNIIRRF